MLAYSATLINWKKENQISSRKNVGEKTRNRNVKTYGVGELNPNFEVASFESLDSELHFDE